MKAAGLLSLDLPPGFTVPAPSEAGDDLLDPVDAPEFHLDFLAEGEGSS
jgi:segregation and condensation protein B